MEKGNKISSLYRDRLKNQPLKGYIFYEYTPRNLFYSIYEDMSWAKNIMDSLSNASMRKAQETFSHLDTYFDQERNNLNVYLNIPFCRRKCQYCHYYTNPISLSGPAFLEQYTDALVQEMELFFSRFNVSDRVSFLAMGGGTPLVLPEKCLRKIFEFLQKRKIAGRSLISVETTPTEVCRPDGRDKLKMLRDFGVKRISFGVQSFSRDILKHVGSRHSKESIFKSYDIVRECGFSHVNFDLLCCLSYEQEEAELEKTFSGVRTLQPEAISLYRLNRIPTFQDRFFAPLKYDYQKQTEILRKIHRELSSLQYLKQGRHYVLNKEGLMSIEKPIVEWLTLGGDWLAFGANGRSTIDKMGFRNVKNSAAYCEDISKNRSPIVIKTTFDQKAFIARYIIHSIATKHMIDKQDFYHSWHIKFDSLFNDPLRYLVNSGFLTDSDMHVSIPEEHKPLDLEIINVLCAGLTKVKNNSKFGGLL